MKKTIPHKKKEGVRINVRLRDMGMASRREADALIEKGVVFVNGKKAHPGMLVQDTDTITTKGAKKELQYVAYHKPKGVATQGDAGEDSVVLRFQKEGLFPVGRLDKESTGLLILTNDGRATRAILGDGVEKEYEVKTREAIREGIPRILASGMTTRIGRLLPAKATRINEHAIRITLREGKKHQVRVMLAELGYVVTSLKRLRIGPVLLGKLPVGSLRPLSPSELQELNIF